MTDKPIGLPNEIAFGQSPLGYVAEWNVYRNLRAVAKVSVVYLYETGRLSAIGEVFETGNAYVETSPEPPNFTDTLEGWATLVIQRITDRHSLVSVSPSGKAVYTQFLDDEGLSELYYVGNVMEGMSNDA